MIVHGTCHHDCPDSCGWEVTVESGVAVKLRGNPDHPFSKGELCPKVNRFLDRVHSPDRLLHPLRRVGPKGAGRFERITWDEALAEIATRLHDVVDRHGAEAVLPFSDAGNQSLLSLCGLDGRFFHHLGASLLDRAICGPTVGHGVRMTNGSVLGLDPLELRHSKLILLWGTNTRLTNRHLWPTIEAARADGARIVVIDPIRTLTADAADEFVQPLPGTDIALMLAMIHVLVRDELVDRTWVDAHTVGYAELAAHVADWTPERAAGICGVDAGVVERLATDYGTIRPAAIRTLIGAEHHENGAMLYRTMAVLPALVGAWQDRGGGLARSVGSWQDALVDSVALGRPDLLAGRTPRELNMSRLGEALTDPSLDPPVAALVVWNCNPLVIVPNAELTRHGLEARRPVHRRPRAVPHRHRPLRRHRPAGHHADREHGRRPGMGSPVDGLERAGDRTARRVVQQHRAVPPPGRAMGFDEPALFDDDATLLAQALGQKVDLDELRRVGWVRRALPGGRPAVGRWRVPDAVGQGRAAQRAAGGDGPAGAADVRRPARGPARRRRPARPVPAPAAGPAAHAVLNFGYSHLPKPGPGRGRARSSSSTPPTPPPAASPTATPPGVERPGLGRAAGPASRHAYRPVSWPIPSVVESQTPTVARRTHSTNDTLTESGRGVAFSDTLVPDRRTSPAGPAAPHGRRVHRPPRHAVAAARRRWRAGSGRCRTSSPFRRPARGAHRRSGRQASGADLRQRRPSRRHQRRRRPPAQLGRRPQPSTPVTARSWSRPA